MNPTLLSSLLMTTLAVALFTESAMAVITVQIGGATRLGSTVRSRDRYRCHWDCDLVGCQLTSDDDECAYECSKICRSRYDYSGRSDSDSLQATPESELKPKSATEDQESQQIAGSENDIVSADQTVRLHLPRNVTARNFGIWERCAQDSNTGKLIEHSFSL